MIPIGIHAATRQDIELTPGDLSELFINGTDVGAEGTDAGTIVIVGGDLIIAGADTGADGTDSGTLVLQSIVSGTDTGADGTDSGTLVLQSIVSGTDTGADGTDSGVGTLGSEIVALTYFTDQDWPTGNIDATAVLEGVGGGEGGTTNTHGGGGGAYARVNAYARAKSTNVAVDVGAGGTTGGGDGGNTTIGVTVLVAEGGGVAGAAAGGRASASTGDVTLDGGAGVTGTGNANGGGSAGSTSAGSGSTPGEPDGTPGGANNNNTAVKIPGAGGRSSTSTQHIGASGYATITDVIPDDVTYPTQVGMSRGRDSANTTSRGATLPSGNVGDRILVFVSSDGVPTITISGYTSIGSDVNGTSVKGEVFERVADGTGSDDITIETSAPEIVAYRVVRNRNAGAATATFANGASGNANPPNHAPGAGSYSYYAACMLDASATTGGLSEFPTDYQGRMIPAGSIAGVALAVTRRKLTASSEDPGTFTNQSDSWVACTVSVPRV